jgi:hypothetical protein
MEGGLKQFLELLKDNIKMFSEIEQRMLKKKQVREVTEREVQTLYNCNLNRNLKYMKDHNLLGWK